MLKVKLMRVILLALIALVLPFLVKAETVPIKAIGETPSRTVDETTVPDSAFKVVDQFKDEVELANGKKVMRIYANPRQVEKTADGSLKLRPKGWNLFNERVNSRISNAVKSGYSYNTLDFFERNNSIAISAGSLDYGNRISEKPAQVKLEQKIENDQNVSLLKDVYKGIDIQFFDREQTRQKNIIIKEKPTNITAKENLIFWEEIQLGVDDTAYIADGTAIVGDRDITQKGLYIKDNKGNRIDISVPIAFDASGRASEFIENPNLYIPKQLVKFDRKTRIFKVGIQMEGKYLLNKERVYPVTIDPVYKGCSEVVANNMTCTLKNFYFRVLNGVSQSDGYICNSAGNCDSNSANNQRIFFGRYNSGTSRYTRHALLYFDLPQLTSLGTVDEAMLHMYYNLNGSGTAASASIKAKQLLSPMNPASIPSGLSNTYSYTNIRGNISANDSAATVTMTPASTWYAWYITNTVKNWYNNPTGYYALIVENADAWSSGTTPPTSWSDRLFVFMSKEYTTDSSPYIQITYTAAVQLPDLIINSKSLSKTTVTPGETISGYVTVKNSGTGSAGSSAMGYYYSTDSTCDTSDTRLDTDSVETLAAGATGAQDTGSLTIPTNATAGTRYICFIADYPGSITEQYENNNTGSVAITVSAVVVDPLEPNNTYSQAYNIGTATTYTNNSLQLTTSDQDWFKFTYNSKVYYFKARGLNTSDVGAYGISFARSGSVVTIQTVQVSGSVDTYLELYDSNATTLLAENDDYTGVFSRVVYDLNPLPDLKPSNGTITSAGTLYGGNQIAYSYTIENLGTTASNGVVHSAGIVDVSNGNTYGLLNESPSSWNLIAGYSGTKTMTANIEDNCSMPYEANYQVSITLDPSNNISESNESNNISNTSNNIKIRRYSTCGGGGGSTPAPDFDSDSYYDSEEYYAGTKITAVDAKPIKDAQYASYTSKKTDLLAYNFAADPVNIRTGAFEFTQTDFSLPGRGEAINFTRTYNSRLFDRNNRMGNGWAHSYNMYYYQDPISKNIEIYLGGASVATYTTTDGGATYTPPVGEFDNLYWENSRLVYQKLDGIKYIFSGTVNAISANMGVLENIVDTNGNVTALTYTSVRSMPLLTTITDASGRSIAFSYGSASDDAKWDKIVRIQDNVNSANPVVITYEYDANSNLVHVQSNRIYNGVSETIDKNFTYTADGKMLTYTDPRGTILYNTFDSNGRVTEQWEYNPNVDAVGAKRKVYTLDYQVADAGIVGSTHCTLVKNYRDLNNFYSDRVCFNSGELKIYQERGTNIEKWAYSALGMPISYTDGNNNIISYEYDTKRRLSKETLPDTTYHTVNTFVYEDTFNRMTRKTETVSLASTPTVPVETKVTNYAYDSYGNLVTLTDPTSNIERREYNTNGTLKKYTSKTGQVVNYTYDAAGNYLASESLIVNQADATTQTVTKNYLYDVYGNRVRYTDPKGNAYNFEYDTKGNLRKAINPDNTYQTFIYDVEDHKLSATDELGRTTVYVYDKDINASLLSVTKSGSAILSQYDWVGNKLKDQDALNREIVYVYDSANRIISKTDPVKTITYEYYNNGQVKKETNTGGARADYFYDVRGNNIEVRKYYDASNYLANKFEYDGFNRKIKDVDGKNNVTIYSYDLMDHLLQADDALNGHTKYFYDANGNKTGELNPRGFLSVSNRNSLGTSVSYVYDGANRVIKKIDANDKYTLYFYDANGNLVKTIDRQNSNGTSNTHVINYLYDNLNRQTKITDALGNFSSQTYDGVGNVLSKTDQMSRIWTYTYDAFNRLTDEFDPANNNTHYTYDKAGNKLTVTDSQSKITQFQYDSLNRLIKVIDSLNNYEDYGYDLLNNKISLKDKRGFTTNYAYDKLNRLTSETNSQNTVINYTYDANSNRLTENIAGKITSYEYDQLNRVNKRIEPGNKVFTFGYDENSNKISELNANSNSVSYTYDKLERLTKKTLPEGEINYGYDQWNNLLSLSDLSGTTAYTYDVLNRNTNEAKTIIGLAGTFNVGREYFVDSGLKSITDAANKKINYNYNNRALLDNVVYASNNLAVYTYTSFGKPLTVTYGNGTVTTYTYDESQRPKSVETKLGVNILFRQDYTYDKESNRTQMVELKLTDGQLTSSTVNYAYDSISQVTNADYNHLATGQNLAYNYDAWGNRTNYHTAFGTTTYNYNANTNEIFGLSLNNKLNVAYATDNNGNIIQENYSLLGKNTKTVNYNWNSENKLNSITYQIPNQTNNVSAFVYDDFGNRVKKAVNGDNTYYLNNGLTVLNEVSATGTILKTMVNGLGSIAEIDQNNNLQYLNQDILGSTVLVTNNTGAIVHQYSYDPFGSIASELGEDSNTSNYLYTGQEFDAESELYYYNARYYNPLLGRFLSKDPIIHRGDGVLGYNEYIYVKNNPLKYTDPSGEINWDLLWEGTKQTVLGGLNTVFGAVEVAGGVTLATGGTVATGGLGAPLAVAGGVGMGVLGANNIVAGTTQLSGGVVNMWNSIFDEKEEAVDYTFNPAHEAINATTEKGSVLNTSLNVGYDVVDVFAGFKATSVVSKLLPAKQIKLVETENTLLKVNAGSKPDLSILEKVSGGLRAHIGFHPTSAAGSPYWHLGLSGFESAVHIPLVPIVSIVKGITSYNTYNSNLVNFDDK